MSRRNCDRTTNVGLLNRWFKETGEAKAWEALTREGLDVLTADRTLRGQLKTAPRNQSRRAWVRATGLAEDELFPLVGASVSKTG